LFSFWAALLLFSFWEASLLFSCFGSLTFIQLFGQPHIRTGFWTATLFNVLGNLTIVRFIFTLFVIKQCRVD
jgi:hypothetical protein